MWSWPGLSEKDNATQTLEEALQDQMRIDFYNSHLTSVKQAMTSVQTLKIYHLCNKNNNSRMELWIYAVRAMWMWKDTLHGRMPTTSNGTRDSQLGLGCTTSTTPISPDTPRTLLAGSPISPARPVPSPHYLTILISISSSLLALLLEVVGLSLPLAALNNVGHQSQSIRSMISYVREYVLVFSNT